MVSLFPLRGSPCYLGRKKIIINFSEGLLMQIFIFTYSDESSSQKNHVKEILLVSQFQAYLEFPVA